MYLNKLNWTGSKGNKYQVYNVDSTKMATIELLLGAVYKHVGEDGMECSFLFSSDPDAPYSRKNLGTTIYFSLGGIIEAALFVRNHGPSYLKDLSIESILKMLREFLINNFHTQIHIKLFYIILTVHPCQPVF